MRKFEFPLAKVLEWRRTRFTVEEAKLGRLRMELDGLESRAAQARSEQTQARRELQSAGSVTGAELVALDWYRRGVMVECARLDGLASGCRQRIEAQLRLLTEADRDVRLLERLHDRKREAWNRELDKVVDREAEELYMANLSRASSY